MPRLKDGLFDGDEFTPIRDFTDNFRGSFNSKKWYDINPRWKGRQPGLFAAKNVKQKRNKLLLKGVYEDENSTAFDNAPPGYETYTTAYVMTKKRVRYGYFEVKAKPSNSRLSSSFWASQDTPTKWTEIDVYELGGGAENKGIDFRRRINMNLHVFRNVKKGIEPGVNTISKPGFYTHSSFLRSKFNVYGIDWSKKWITWTFNGRAIRRERNKYWKQALPIKFDVETMPNWFGLPSKETLPATYKIKYIRTWSRTSTTQASVRRNSVRTTRLSNPFQLGEMFGFNNSSLQTFPSLGAENVVDDEEEDSDVEDDGVDNAETEVFPTEPETAVPQDVLQRSPIPGSNEIVYRPVVPPLGQTWRGIIENQNAVLDDIFGAQIVPGENINLADFDEELLMFSSPNAQTTRPKPTGLNMQDNPTTQPAATPAPQEAQTPGSPISGLKPGEGIFSSFPSLQ